MIGIVVVSHSRALAEAAVALAAEMVEESARPSITVAAGLDESTFGTDAAAVAEAISAADSPDGVLLLLDLGSAVLSAEMALELVEPELAGRVRVSSAPLVEGLVAAAVLASTGASVAEVDAEARRGLAGKQQHLDDPDDASMPPADGSGQPTDEGGQSVEVDVSNLHGLHARPAARLVALVRSYDARVSLTNRRSGRGPVDAASVSMVATLNVRKGDRLRVEAAGDDAAAVLAAVEALAGRRFDDADDADDAEPAPATTAASGQRSSGSGLDIAIGPAIVAELDVDTGEYEAGDLDQERAASAAAVEAARAQLSTMRDSSQSSDDASAGIFGAQLELLDDPVIRKEVATSLEAGCPATEAWAGTLGRLEREFAQLDDAYQRERAQDVRSVRRRVEAALTGRDADPALAEETAEGILVVPELDAATAAALDPQRVLGVVTVGGGATGHGVIVAKSRGVPVITDVSESAAAVAPGELVGFDARDSRFVVEPDAAEEAGFRAEIERRAAKRAKAVAAAAGPADTRDGVHVTVAANVTSVDDARAAARYGADGSGLLRTEVLFGGLSTRPGVDAQLAAFGSVAEALGRQPLTIRTWDVGGDKPLPFLPQPKEANPFLGERGLRLMQRQPEVLREQLAAVCLAARESPVKVMFPMVSSRDEVTWALAQLRQAASEVTGEVPSGLGVGIMVEVPAAALRIAQLAVGLDFVSIGTNDLTQYVLAAERGNTAVSDLVQPLDPAVLWLVDRVCRTVPEGVEVAVCGDLASDAEAAALLVGLGVRELSAVPAAVPVVKAAVREVDTERARQLADRSLDCVSAAEVRELLRAHASA